MATATVETPKKAQRKVVCPFGCEYSATPGDYWSAKDTTPITCTHDDETYPCELVESVWIFGTDDNGRYFHAQGWATVAENATVGDVRYN